MGNPKTGALIHFEKSSSGKRCVGWNGKDEKGGGAPAEGTACAKYSMMYSGKCRSIHVALAKSSKW